MRYACGFFAIREPVRCPCLSIGVRACALRNEGDANGVVLRDASSLPERAKPFTLLQTKIVPFGSNRLCLKSWGYTVLFRLVI